MPAYAHKIDHLARAQRLSQIERFVLLGLTLAEMADRLGVSIKTIQRDLKTRVDTWSQDIERSTQVYRQSILSELGRLYAEMTRDAATARAEKRDTHQYGHARIDILRMVARLTGADAPIKVELSVAQEGEVPELELIRMLQIRNEIEAEVSA